MRQLVELQKNKQQFKELNAEVIVVFREEKEGVDGLKKIKSRTKTEFTLAVDLNKKSSAAYSPDRMTFNNYVIDREGVIRDVIPGKLRTRATSERLLKTLKAIGEK